MKIQSGAGSVSVAALALLVALGGAACGGKDDNANASRNTGTISNLNTNADNRASTTSPPETASQDTALKNTVEANLTKNGVSGVTVVVENGEVTLKGTVTQEKRQAALQAAHESKPRKVNNQLNVQ